MTCTAAGVLVAGAIIAYKARNILRMPIVWFILTVIIYFFCTSGFIYDILHKTPLVGVGKTGGMEFIHKGQRS
jgi:hypothetical protein